LLTLALQLSGLVTPWEWLLRDTLLRLAPERPTSQVALVLIDEAALRSEGSWPWDRAKLSRLVSKIYAAGAKGVAVDLLLPESRVGDEVLAQALAQGPSVLAAGVDDTGHGLWPAPLLQRAEMGHVGFDLDQDGVVRHFAATREVDGRALLAFPVAAARLGDPSLLVPVGLTLYPAFRARVIPTVSAGALMAQDSSLLLRGRIVFIGVTAAGLGDRVITPVTRRGATEPGVLVEAQAAEAILSKDLLRPSSPLLNAILAFGLAWLGALLVSAPGRARSALALVLILAPLPLAAGSSQALHLELAPLAMVMALGITGGAAAWVQFRESRLSVAVARRRITELEVLQAHLSEAQMQEAEARRVVAHELKTPLTSVRGLAQLLAQFDLSEAERTRVAGMVVSEASRLAQMVDALLDIERLRLRDYRKDAHPLDLSALCAARVTYLMAGTDRPLEAQVTPDVQVLGDEGLLARVLENLVSNALKFSPGDAPVRVGLRAENGQAVIEVEDHGPGIPEAERKRIFGRFARGSTQGLAPGLGLGLALVAEVVAWHRGTVIVAAGRQGGSRFEVRLPLASVD
jgi:signal transduction histidine kinase